MKIITSKLKKTLNKVQLIPNNPNNIAEENPKTNWSFKDAVKRKIYQIHCERTHKYKIGDLVKVVGESGGRLTGNHNKKFIGDLYYVTYYASAFPELQPHWYFLSIKEQENETFVEGDLQLIKSFGVNYKRRAFKIGQEVQVFQDTFFGYYSNNVGKTYNIEEFVIDDNGNYIYILKDGGGYYYKEDDLRFMKMRRP